ncbi:MAG: hypothetical protein QME79_07720 [Bacillota bacterium]|nr:hypothetical protein [Bacillota bacterium]
MDAPTLFRKLREAGCELRAEGERLKVRAPKGFLTPDLRALIEQHKPELLRLLSPARGARPVSLPASLWWDGMCLACGAGQWWLSIYGALICATCHRPAATWLVERLVGQDEAARLALAREEANRR